MENLENFLLPLSRGGPERVTGESVELGKGMPQAQGELWVFCERVFQRAVSSTPLSVVYGQIKVLVDCDSH